MSRFPLTLFGSSESVNCYDQACKLPPDMDICPASLRLKVEVVASYFHQSQCATSEWMSFASTMAASMVAKMLKDPTVFREWPHYNQGRPHH